MVKMVLISDTHYGMDGKTHTKHMKFWRRLAKEIKEKEIKVLIWAGDLASFRQRHLRRSLEMAREFINIPIVLVRGNHDFWDGEDKQDPGRSGGIRSLDKLFDLHRHWFIENNIHHLEDNPFIIEDVIITGFDGWYATHNPGTNDKNWMPKFVKGQPFVQEYLVNKAWRDFDECLKVDTTKFRKSIIVTHHNPYPFAPYPGYKTRPVDDLIADGVEYSGHGANLKFLVEIREKFDIMCCGHTHVYKNDDVEGLQIYNCGSDYNSPKWLIFEV